MCGMSEKRMHSIIHYKYWLTENSQFNVQNDQHRKIVSMTCYSRRSKKSTAMRFCLIRLNMILVLSSRVSIFFLLNVPLLEHRKQHILMYEKNKPMKNNICREDTQKRDYDRMPADSQKNQF